MHPLELPAGINSELASTDDFYNSNNGSVHITPLDGIAPTTAVTHYQMSCFRTLLWNTAVLFKKESVLWRSHLSSPSRTNSLS